MKKVNYYCDCCGKEVSSQEELTNRSIHSDFKHMQDNPCPYDVLEICKDCNGRIEDAINYIIKDIQKNVKER